MFESTNWWAVLVAYIFANALGFFWYSTAAFGSVWLACIRKTKKDMEATKNRMVLGLVASLILTLALAYWTDRMGTDTARDGAVLAFMLWFGLVFPMRLSMAAWEGSPWKLLWLNAGYDVISLCVQGMILGAWH